MAVHPSTLRNRALFYAAALLWLPAGMVVSAAIRFGTAPMASEDWTQAAMMAASSLVVAAVCGLPLAFACRRLARLGQRRWAWIAGIALGAATVATVLPAGLFGPPGIAIVAVLLSLPVWIAALWLGWRARARGSADGTPLDGREPRP